MQTCHVAASTHSGQSHFPEPPSYLLPPPPHQLTLMSLGPGSLRANVPPGNWKSAERKGQATESQGDGEERQGGGDTGRGPILPAFLSGLVLHGASTCPGSAPGIDDTAINEAKPTSQEWLSCCRRQSTPHIASSTAWALSAWRK